MLPAERSACCAAVSSLLPPDVIARVFRQKLTELLEDLTHSHVFGEPLAHAHVVTATRRGLPCAVVLLVIAPWDAAATAEELDARVSAELPDPVTQPVLYDVVSRYMMHKPCGSLRRAQPHRAQELSHVRWPRRCCTSATRILQGHRYRPQDHHGQRVPRAGRRRDMRPACRAQHGSLLERTPTRRRGLLQRNTNGQRLAAHRGCAAALSRHRAARLLPRVLGPHRPAALRVQRRAADFVHRLLCNLEAEGLPHSARTLQRGRPSRALCSAAGTTPRCHLDDERRTWPASEKAQNAAKVRRNEVRRRRPAIA